MRRLLALLIFLSFSQDGFAAVHRTGLKAAMDKGLVKVSAISTGALYNGKALKLELVNTTRDALQLRVDPALIFWPTDSTYQELVLAGSEMLTLAPGRAGELSVQTFCAKAKAAGPRAKIDYVFKRQGDSVMIRVLEYIRKYELFDALGQAAIWALTDERNLEGLIDPARPKTSSDLLALMVSLTGWAVPEYFKVYKLGTEAGQPVFQKRILKIVAKLEWTLQEPKALSLGIFSEKGEEVQTVFRNKALLKGGYRMQVEFEAEGVPPGPYYMRLKDGNDLMKELVVVVD